MCFQQLLLAIINREEHTLLASTETQANVLCGGKDDHARQCPAGRSWTLKAWNKFEG